MQAVVDGRSRTDKNTRLCNFLPDIRQLRAVGQAVLQQVGHKTLVAGQFVADTDERMLFGNSRIDQHAANLVYRTVGIREQQQRGLRVGQCLFHHVAQGTRRLSRSRRSYQQEIVAGLLLLQNQFVESSVISLERQRGIALWRTYSQQQFLPFGTCRQKGIESPHGTGGRYVRGIVLDGKHISFVADDVFVLLTVSQQHRQPVGSNLYDVSFHQNLMTHVRFVLICIADDDISSTEVGKKILLLARNAEVQQVVSFSGSTLPFVGEFQSQQYVSRFQLLCHRSVPQSGKPVRRLVAAGLAQNLLLGDESKETLEICPLQWGRVLQGLDDFLQLRLLKIGPQATGGLELIQQVGTQFFHDRSDGTFAEGHLRTDNPVSQPDTFAEKGFGKMFDHQSVGILGVQQEGLQVLCLVAEIVHQYSLIEHHLDEMVLLVTAVVLVALTRLLFNEHLEILLQHIHTSLQSEFLTDE